MLARDPVALVRENKAFVALSDTSMKQLAIIRSALCLPDADPASTFDDALVAALYRVMCQNTRLYAQWEPPSPVAAAVKSTATSLLEKGKQPAKESDGSNNDRLGTDHVGGAGHGVTTTTLSDEAPSAAQLGWKDVVFQCTAGGGKPVIDVTRRCATAACPAHCRRAVALVRYALAPSGTHRCSIRVLETPSTSPDDSTPHCLFGLCSRDVLLRQHGIAANWAATANWACLQWSVGMSVPHAPTLAAVSVFGNPHVQAVSTFPQLLIKAGDVITAELTCTVPAAAAPIARPPVPDTVVVTSGGGASPRPPAPPPPPQGSLILSFLINGVPVISLRDAQRYQPIAGTSTGATQATSLLPRSRGEAVGISGCQFGVLLSRGVSVALLSPEDV